MTAVKIVCAVVALLCMPNAHAAKFHVYTIDFPGAVGTTTAYSINERGQIVGAFAPPGTECATALIGCQGYLLDNGVFTPIAVPGATTTLANWD